MNRTKLLQMAVIFTLVQGTGPGLWASETKSNGLRSFIIDEMETLQDLFQDHREGEGGDSESDLLASAFSLRVMGKAAIGLPGTAKLEFKPSIEVYFKPQ
ncbi:MAG: hypothetical protein ACXVLQ_15730 [Bacteriovorax sp.]